MEAGYTIESNVYNESRFFYLYNWQVSNIVDLYGFSVERKNPKEHNPIGIWKIKLLKN